MSAPLTQEEHAGDQTDSATTGIAHEADGPVSEVGAPTSRERRSQYLSFFLTACDALARHTL